jgi:hypothetical protein
MSGNFVGRVAFASVRYGLGPGPVITTQSGDFSGIGASGLGQVQLNFGDEIDPNEALAFAMVRGTQGYCDVRSWLDTSIVVRITNSAGAAADIDFDLMILVKPNV